MPVAKRILAALGVSVVMVLGTTGLAGAQSDGDGAYVGGVTTVPQPAAPSDSEVEGQVLGATETAGSSAPAEVRGSALAFTGGDVVVLVTVGGIALVGGLGLLVLRRRGVTAPA